MFQQNVHFEATGIVGEIIGVILLSSVLVAACWNIWTRAIRPGYLKWRDRRTHARSIAFLDFQVRWLLNQPRHSAVFMLDERRNCVFANDVLLDMLHADSSDILGKAWHKVIRNSELESTLFKWNRAYEAQSPYSNVSVMIVMNKEKRFLVHAEPFVFNGKVRNYLGTVSPYDIIE